VLSIDPFTGRRLRAYQEHGPARVEAALARAEAAFKEWREAPFEARSRVLRAAARILRRDAEEFAGLMTAEMGKPIAQSRAEVEKCAGGCQFFARHAREFLSEERPAGAAPGGRVVFQPIGTVLAIMPWNFPFWQAFRAAAPALMAGNTMLLKHASNVCGCALAIGEIFAAAAREAGAPARVAAGLFQTLLVSSRRIPALIADPRVRAVTLTGSTAAGKRVAALAGEAMKKGVFELGGSDPYLILEDADLDLAAEVCAQARLVNSGQSCICAKRFIAVPAVRREFERKFAERLEARRLGDPRDSSTEIGPLARPDLRDELHAQVRESVRLGARLLLGGSPLPGPGNFYPPTLLSAVRPGQPAYREELFGPVAAVIAARDERAAVAIANDSIYGLGAAVFSRRRSRARAVADRLEAGLVFINDFVRSEPALPFGGVKESGYGRELGVFGLREFVNVKTVRG
jgi:succinate-semialdehyde dehydrogenase/glutarate-semialdehyde dehydrogenase